MKRRFLLAMPLLLAALFAVALNFFVLINASVPSESMEPSIAAGGNVLALRRAYKSSEPQRGDIVIFKKEELTRRKLIKRVIATAGEAVRISNGRVFLNSSETPLEEPYVLNFGTREMAQITVPDGSCFVLGDNRTCSGDSSVWAEPFVEYDNILAKTVYIYKGEGFMGIISTVIGTPLGYLMKFCYDIIGNYGIAIIVFTLLTRFIMLPVSLLVQKNSIKMLKMRPKLDALRFKYTDDKDKFLDEQIALYKSEKYHSMTGILPLILQLVIIFGLISVMYNPLTHLLHIPADVINAFIQKAGELFGNAEMGNQAQIKVLEFLNNPQYTGEFLALQNSLGGYDVAALIEKIQSMDMSFLGLNLAALPSLSSFDSLLVIPLLAGVSSLLLCLVQNRQNVLQAEQSKASQWGMTIFMIAFSAFFAFIVPAGMGIYWVCGNLFGILMIYIVNLIYNPKKYIDYKYLDKMKELTQREHQKIKENKPRDKADYKRFCSESNAGNIRLMFYSEQSGFYKYFQNIIEALLKNSDVTIHYVTSDPNDAIFKMNNPRIETYYIGEKHLIPLMMKVEADIVVMTMPDLEKYHIKRSKVRKDVEYIYVDHACASLNLTYRAGAFDYFDTIFAVSRSQALEVRATEKLRGTKKKRIIEYGYGLIDNMIEAYHNMPQAGNSVKTVLIAPSWQEDNILDSCLDEMLEGLIGKGYRIVVRPHPQYVRRFPMNFEAILEKYSSRQDDNFIIETDFSSNVTVYTADLVITDWSSIGFEFSFTTDMPTLFVNTKLKVVNPDYEKIDIVPFTIEARSQVGKAIEKDEMGTVLETVRDLIENRAEYSEQIIKVKNSHFYNLGHSGEVGAEYIIESLNRKQKS